MTLSKIGVWVPVRTALLRRFLQVTKVKSEKNNAFLYPFKPYFLPYKVGFPAVETHILVNVIKGLTSDGASEVWC